jgi:sigma-E factor negative regulatory protein RseB
VKALCLLLLCASSAQAANALPPVEAAKWLRMMSDASRHLSYQGVFVVRQGDAMQTLSITNRPTAQGNESSLKAMDGSQREVRCSHGGAVTVSADGSQLRIEKRLNNRHFPDLLPADPAALVNWYDVSLGDVARVAGLDCRNIEILPKDNFRWGYILCAEKDSGLPIKAMVVNARKQPLMQYAFAELKLGVTPKLLANQPLPTAPEPPHQLDTEDVSVTSLPPGFARIAAFKRHLPDMPGEVEHWIFSDGLTHISLFLAPTQTPLETVRGASARGMVNLMRRQIGEFQATVLGDAPWPAVEAIAMGLEPKK